jgi:hypothetical protein
MTPTDAIGGMRRRQFLAATATISLGSGCASTPPPDGALLDTEFERFVADWVRLTPERATTLQYFSGAEQDALASGAGARRSAL